MTNIPNAQQPRHIHTHILGSGLAGGAIAKALALLRITDSDLPLGDITHIPRDADLKNLKPDGNTVLCIANPSALHTGRVLEGIETGYRLIVCEKPTSTDKEQLKLLEKACKTTNVPIAVLHVYRQLWGIQHLRSMVERGEFGRICAIEGKLWQASRVRHLSSANNSRKKREWANDKQLTGEYGVSLGLGTHWLDTAQFLAGEKLELLACHKDSLRDGSGSDDTYIHYQFRTPHDILVSGSITNMAHGARNDFEIAIIGERASAQWSLMEPDQILMGHGTERGTVYRHDMTIGSGQPAFHGVGWLEGYIEILRQSYRHLLGLPYQSYPTIIESNEVISLILNMMG
jgi:predicted dehydrogenase